MKFEFRGISFIKKAPSPEDAISNTSEPGIPEGID
jgi:hypothetical protein